MALRHWNSAAFTNEPVGLLGLTISNALVRLVTARSTLAMSTIQAREVVEKRVTGPRYQHFIPSVGEQFEDHRVRVARAGRQYDAVLIDRDAPAPIVGGDRPPRLGQAERARLIRQPAGVRERRQQIGRVLEPCTCWIRLGQIQQRPGGSRALHRQGQPVAPEIVWNARGERHRLQDIAGGRGSPY